MTTLQTIPPITTDEQRIGAILALLGSLPIDKSKEGMTGYLAYHYALSAIRDDHSIDYAWKKLEEDHPAHARRLRRFVAEAVENAECH